VADRIPQVANVVISNVPGPPVPLYLAGAKMLTNYPTSIVVHGMALNSHVGRAEHCLRLRPAVARLRPDGRRRRRCPTCAISAGRRDHAPAVLLIIAWFDDGQDVESVVAHFQRLLAVIGSPAYPPDPERLRERLRASVQRSWHPAGTVRQLMAIMADGDRTPLLARISAPVCVIHGQADPLVPVAAAHHLVQHLRDARSDFIPGMGHDLPLALLPRLAAGIADNVARANAD
jgi:pimeloyl-ACP methyl ester carboxylesterase